MTTEATSFPARPRDEQDDVIFSAAVILATAAHDPVRQVLRNYFPYAEQTYEYDLGVEVRKIYAFAGRVVGNPAHYHLDPQEKRIIADALLAFEVMEAQVLAAAIPELGQMLIDDLPASEALRPFPWGQLNARLLAAG